MRTLALTGLSAFVLALALVPLCRTAALRFGYVARPRDDRWHRRPTALMGGVAIAATVLGLHVVWAGPRVLPLLVAGAGLVFLIGLVDDFVSLKPYAKLVAEIAVASLFVFFGYRLGWTESLTIDTLLTMFWIVGLTNAFNLLDNMDGLCAGVGLVTGTALLGTFVLTAGVTPEARYLALLLGALAGFLVYNAHPASIFMGDSGSLFIGANLAVLTLVSPYDGQGQGSASVLSTVAAPLLVVLVPIFDTALVTASRVLSGRSIAQGGRDHSSHRLVAMGLSESRAVAVLWALAALGGLLAISIRNLAVGWPSIATAVFLLAVMIFAVHLSQIRVYHDADRALLRSDRITPFVVRFVYRRRIVEVLLDVCLVSLAYYAAYSLRFEGPEFAYYFRSFLVSLPLVVGVQIMALLAAGAYRGVWQYYSLMDGVTFARGVLLGTLAIVGAIVYVYRFEDYSRGVFVIYAALLLLLLIGSRASFRLLQEFAHRQRGAGQRVVIYGARAGAAAARGLLDRVVGEHRMLGFIDDDPAMARTRMHGYPVLGDCDALALLIAAGRVDAVVMTTLPADPARLSRLQAVCAEHDVTLSRLDVALREVEAAL